MHHRTEAKRGPSSPTHHSQTYWRSTGGYMTSTDAIVSVPQAVRERCESYCFETLSWEVTEESGLTIWGNDDFEVYEAQENGFRITTVGS